MTTLPFRFFDCDNHYYEAMDAFTRHLEPGLPQARDAVGPDRRQDAAAGRRQGQQVHPEPDVRPGGGARRRWTSTSAGRNPKSADTSELFGELEPIRPEYRDRDARLAVMDQQGMEGCDLAAHAGGRHGAGAAPTTCPALTAAFRAFNRWLDEDWGFAYQGRIFAAPYITLIDPDNAVRELEWALEHDARFVVMVGGPVITPAGGAVARRPDVRRVLALANDAGITVLLPRRRDPLHEVPRPTGARATSPRRSGPARSAAWCRPTRLQDTIASHAGPRPVPPVPEPADGLDRGRLGLGVPPVREADQVLRPGRRTCSRRTRGRRSSGTSGCRRSTRTSWPACCKAWSACEHILMGSDYPHVEGLTEPAATSRTCRTSTTPPSSARAVMRDNGLFLATRLAG